MKKEFVVERNGRNFVLYAGLLDLAHEHGLRSITTTLVQIPSDLNGHMAIVHATVETAQGTFTGLGDAAPDSVSRMMQPHLIRLAETRAKARALRDAVNVGVTALEELADLDDADAEDERRHGPVEDQAAPRARSTGKQAVPVHGLRALEPIDVVGAEDGGAPQRAPARLAASGAGRGNGDAGEPAGGTAQRPGAAPATAKQLQTIERMARAAGKTIDVAGLTRAQASEIISGLITDAERRAS